MIKKEVLFLIGLIFIISLVSSLVSAADVAYIYKNKIKIDPNFISAFNELGLSVDQIQDTKVRTTDFSKYRFIFVTDERFRKPNEIPVTQYPSVITNYYFGEQWGLTDNDGISKLASNNPLSVNKNNQIIQVYTTGVDGRGVGIPYYFLDDENKAPGFFTVARTYTGNQNDDYNFGDVIAYANDNSHLINGKYTEGKICFYGIVKTQFWTPQAKQMFLDCVRFVSIKCYDDSECDDNNEHTYDYCKNPGTLNSTCEYEPIECLSDNECDADYYFDDNFCLNDDVFKNFKDFTCENPGERNARCVNATIPKIQENCTEIQTCFNGACFDVTCKQNSDCGTDGWIDNPVCQTENVFQNYKTFTCNNPGMWNSNCSSKTELKLNETCSDTCMNGECVTIECYNNSDCDDNSIWTKDTCHNPGTFTSYCTNEPIKCFEDTNCGIDGFSGNKYCGIDGNIYKDFKDFTCNNPGLTTSFCSNATQSDKVSDCSGICLNGNCINCTKNLDCDDNSVHTFDTCIFPNTTSSYCRNDPINCFDNNDCGVTGFFGENFCSNNDVFKNYKNSTCKNPGTLNSYCEISQGPKLLTECGNDYCESWKQDYCKNNDVYHARNCFTKTCSSGGCISNLSIEEELVEQCAYGCLNGDCVKVHDVALIDIENGIDKIRLKASNGSYILDNKLICNNKYEIGINAENQGGYIENVTFNGNINGLLFNHNPIPNFAPADTTIKTKTVNMTLLAGFYNIFIEAVNPFDADLSDNTATRQIEILCEQECEIDADCGEKTCGEWRDGICIAGDVWKERTCLVPYCDDGQCQLNETIETDIERCEYGCTDGKCNDKPECTPVSFNKTWTCSNGLNCEYSKLCKNYGLKLWKETASFSFSAPEATTYNCKFKITRGNFGYWGAPSNPSTGQKNEKMDIKINSQLFAATVDPFCNNEWPKTCSASCPYKKFDDGNPATSNHYCAHCTYDNVNEFTKQIPLATFNSVDVKAYDSHGFNYMYIECESICEDTQID